MNIKNTNFRSKTEECLNCIQFPQENIEIRLKDQNIRFFTSDSMKHTIYNGSFITLLICGYFRRFGANPINVSQIVAQYISQKKMEKHSSTIAIEGEGLKFKYKGSKDSLFTLFHPLIFWQKNALNGISAASEKVELLNTTITVRGYVNYSACDGEGINDWYIGVIGIENNVKQIRNFIAILNMYAIKFPDEKEVDNFYELMQLPEFKQNGFKLGTNITIYHLWQHCRIGFCDRDSDYGVATGFGVVSCDQWRNEPILNFDFERGKCDSSKKYCYLNDAVKTTYIMKLQSNTISFYYNNFEHPVSFCEHSKALGEKHHNVVSENELITLPDKDYFYFPIFQTTGDWRSFDIKLN